MQNDSWGFMHFLSFIYVRNKFDIDTACFGLLLTPIVLRANFVSQVHSSKLVKLISQHHLEITNETRARRNNFNFVN